MRIAITGATGLIGSALAADLAGDGHAITVVSRRADVARRVPGAKPNAVVLWDPAAGAIDAAALEAHDVVIHLAGEPISGVWTTGKKRRIRESRVRGTHLLARTLAALDRPPRALLSASGVNYYGDRDPAEVLDESSPPGDGFLADIARAWEAATEPAAAAGIRTVCMRLGAVLTAAGGMLAALLPLFRLGLGGKLGSGAQVVSWIALEDVVGAVRHVINDDALSGALNFVAPHAVTNAEFTRTLGRVLGRPTPFTVPAFAIRLLPGGMGEELLLGGARIAPRRLLESGFRFRYPTLESALRAALAEPRARRPA